MATTLLKVYMLRVFYALSRYHPDVEIHTYVDDVDMSASKVAASSAALTLAAATRALLRLFDTALLLQVAYYKCVVLASSSNVEECRDNAPFAPEAGRSGFVFFGVRRAPAPGPNSIMLAFALSPPTAVAIGVSPPRASRSSDARRSSPSCRLPATASPSWSS